MSHKNFGGWFFFPCCLNFTITPTTFSTILILALCLVVSRLHSNDAGVPGLLFPRVILLYVFFSFSFFSIRPTDPISVNAFDAKRKKKGMALCSSSISCSKLCLILIKVSSSESTTTQFFPRLRLALAADAKDDKTKKHLRKKLC